MNIKKGNPLQKGSTKQKDGYNFAIASAAEIIDLLLYAPKADEPEYRIELTEAYKTCLLYTSPSPRDAIRSRMPASA